MSYPSTLPPTSQAPTSERPPRNPRRTLFAIGFAVVAIVITIGSIVLAAIAPSLNTTAAPTVPAGWSTIYDADLQPGEPQWPSTPSCVLESEGLHVTGGQDVGVLCPFGPSRRQALLDQGFMLTVSLAPGADVQSLEEALIVLGDSGELRLDQTGSGEICTPSCSTRLRDATITSLSAFAWHGEAGNTITLRWLGQGNQFELYTNGQQLTTVAFQFDSTNEILELGTPKNDEAIYTHMTLYTPS